ncbi:hypothetical protein HDU76_013935 [Blyttiomyces sp. JEL0837]|nr:hypothetical protein HDU76_013935 [Blyttiomyces sp. JEL0837]
MSSTYFDELSDLPEAIIIALNQRHVKSTAMTRWWTQSDYLLLEVVAISGLTDVFKSMMVNLSDTEFNPGMEDNLMIQLACQNGHLELVKELVKFDSVDVTASSNHALRFAAKYGHFDVVKLLVGEFERRKLDVEVNLNDVDGFALISACQGGYLNIVDLLILKGAHVSLGKGLAVTRAIEGGRVEVVRRLVESGKVGEGVLEVAKRWVEERDLGRMGGKDVAGGGFDKVRGVRADSAILL